MSASDTIASIALGVSVLSAALAILSIVLAFRESKRRDEEIGHLRREATRRDEELDLLRQQVAGQLDERLRQQQADISVGQRVRAEGMEHRIDYQVPVQNTGSHVAREVKVELVAEGAQLVGTGHLERALFPGEGVIISVETPPRDRYTGPYEIFVLWHDGRGGNRKSSGVRVGLPA